MTTAAVRVHDLVVVRGGTRVLPGVSLDIPAGAVTGVVGPSGSGKTTLMRAIVGVQVVASGSVTVLDRPAGTRALRREVAYVTQAPSVYHDLTVRENLRYFARVVGADPRRVEEVTATVGLAASRDQVVRTLSGGEVSRVSLAVALLGAPRLLVLDEPTVGLDPVLRRDLWRAFHDLADAGATLVVSTHVMDEAERCDHLVLLREGTVVATGSPAELKERTHAPDMEGAFLALAEGDR